MNAFFENILNSLSIFDLFFFIILIYNVIQCFLKGFSLSLISFMKWVISAIVTIILLPKFQPIVLLDQSISRLKDNLLKINFSNMNFRDSSFMRLNTLNEHINKGRIDKNLRWKIF